MKRILMTTALVTAFAGPALAESHTAQAFLDQMTYSEAGATDILASDLIGKPLYVTNSAIDGNTVDVDAIEWERVGDVNDIVLNSDGVQAVILDIGGFLGMGEKQVAMDLNSLNMVSGVNDGAEIYLVFTGDRAALEAAGEFDVDTVGMWAEDAETEMDAAATDTNAEAAPVTNTTGDMRPMYAAPAPQLEREGFENVAWDRLTTEDLTGAVVYDTADQNIGEIDRLYVSDDGKITGAVLDVGGFLGLGEKPVLVSMDSLTIHRDGDGGLRVYVDASEADLEAMKEHQD